MAFCSFSKEYDENAYTLVENKFISKYLPSADGFAVKVYLYGLYLCKNSSEDYSLAAMAEVLSTSEEAVKQAFKFWEDYDLVQVLCNDPFAVSYLPVSASVGTPKRIRYEKYTDFNKELQRKMQKVGKFISYNASLKYMQFLEENDIQPQAFLLIAEYCIAKQGEKVSASYIFNKAKKYIKLGWTTYLQVERELNNCNANEKEVLALFNALNLTGNPDENDYSLYQKWLDSGFDSKAILTAAKRMKKGGITALALSIEELIEKGKFNATDVENYLTEREELTALTFRIGKKLGAKIGNPSAFTDEYTEKWREYGFEDESLLDIATYCLKTERSDFSSMNEILSQLFSQGIVSLDSVKDYLKSKNDCLKLFAKLREVCAITSKNAVGITMVETWRGWSFTDEMILEAGKRATGTANPIPYMNKILSDWKREGINRIESIPAPTISAKTSNANAAIIENINAKTDRERYYAIRREKAQSVADKFIEKANSNAEFKKISQSLSKMEISLAKAEVFTPEKLPALQEEKAGLIRARKAILTALGIEEWQLLPQYSCKQCSDTGFLPNGTVCKCYAPSEK
ncbi:MAG: DnaD domain protein [Clostridia bacterium]|nr:DnaD domain protein [Clostridia bacterium]